MAAVVDTIRAAKNSALTIALSHLAARVKGTVGASDIPITKSRAVSEAVERFSVRGV